LAAEPILLRADQVAAGSGVIYQGAVKVVGGRIEEVGDQGEVGTGSGRVLECAVLLPGFIDLHTHGLGGHSFSDSPDDVRGACRLAVRSGVTSLFATLGESPSLESTAASLAAVSHVVGRDTRGARVLGSFLEGPYISEKGRGAWDAHYLRLPSVQELDYLVSAAGNTLRRVNVAPELPGAFEFIQAAREMGLVVSIGHSDASYEEAMAAVAAGATVATHTYNAMSPLAHRAPGMVGAVLSCQSILAELVLDGVHVHPAAAIALYAARGPSGVALVTDSSPVAGLPDGTYTWGTRQVTVRQGACRLPDGTLAGSVARFDESMRNARTWLTDDVGALGRLCASNAAEAMGVGDHLGYIAPGYEADLTLLGHDFEVLATLVGGEVLFERS
jgi:N-acetylglucosamine-6-phosphate deacetylase